MTARKKWRVVYPGAFDEHLFRSEPAAYEFVGQVRDTWAEGGPTSTLTVQVDEGLGFGWQYYEHIDFAEEAS